MQSVGKASLLSRCTSSAGYLARPVGRLDGQRWVVSRVQQRPDIGIDSASTAELWELHEELLREIEERKKYQSQLLEKLDRIRSAPVARTAAPPAPPAPPAPTVPKVAPPRIPSPTPRVPAYRPVPSPPPAPLPAPPLPPKIQYVAEPVAPAEPAKPPPLAGENVMNIVMVGAECAPWSKTGGLGDVMGALPKAFARRGHRVMAIAPRYAVYQEAWETGVRKTLRVCNSDQEVGFFHSYVDGVDYVFVDHPSFHNRSGGEIYGGDRESLQFRCALLSKAALEAVWHVPCGGITYGDENLVFIANDWHTALVPIYLQAHYRDYNQMTYARCVFIIHNLAHQGRGPFVEADKLELNEHYKEQLRLYDPVGGEHMNWMKGAFINAHRIIAVSNGYAWECKTQEGGWGLDSILREQDWKLQGIVNGIDYNEWSPMKDVFLKEDGYCNYSTETLDEGKAKCKAALQRELGLPVDPNVPLLGFIGRLDYQKGVDLITESYDWLMAQGVQLVMLGSGRQDLEEQLRNMESRNKNQCRAWVGFSVKMAHRITAGCDILLMPSRFEPCGLNQLYSMAYGMVPVVHSVGGLRDTVQQFDPFAENGQGKGTGWTFDRAESTKLRDAIYNAISTYRNHRDAFKRIQIRGMSQDMSWDNAAQVYEQVLVAAKYQW